MKLLVTETVDRYRVEQQGGFCPENKVILRAVCQNSERSEGIYWYYPKGPGVLQSIEHAARLMAADIEWPKHLRKELDRVKQLTEKEESLRKTVQKYMDSKDPLPGYVSRAVPSPWRHQQISYHWSQRVDQIYIAHKPGLGKTRTGADIIRGLINRGMVRTPQVRYVRGHYSVVFPKEPVYEHYATVGGVLIVCPSIVLGTWRDELLRWQGLPSLIINSYSADKKRERAQTPAWIHICTYGSLHFLQDNVYDVMIVDEAHTLANEDTRQYAWCLHLRQSARFVMCLSGTPVSNMLPSLWAQFYFLDGGRTLGTSYETYKRQYFDVENRKLIAKEGADAEIAKKVSRVTYFLTMRQAFPDKHEKVDRVVKIPMTKEQLHYYHRVRSDLVAQIQTGHITAPEINQKMTKLLQICQGFVIDDEKKVYNFSSAKLDAIRGMILRPDGEFYFGHTRTIIWCSLRRDLERIVGMLTKGGVPTTYLHGDIAQRDRDAIKDAWNSDYRWRVLVGMIQIGIGINLHAPNCVDAQGAPARCSNTIFSGVTWRVTQLEQAMDRVYRGDQVEPCLYTYLLSEDIYGSGEDPKPIDTRVYDSLQLKLSGAQSLSEDSTDYVRSLIS